MIANDHDPLVTELSRLAQPRPDGADEEFVRAYRARSRRPLRAAHRPPPGLLPALRGRRSAAPRMNLGDVTEFERDVLLATSRIPAGQTRPYNWVAARIGRPRAVRAVGTAPRNNPVPILIPCHRVTLATGEPGEYVVGSELKQRLLRAEREVYFASDTTRVVCCPTCAHARRITRPHRRGFRTADEARRHGYRPCARCRPATTVPA